MKHNMGTIERYVRIIVGAALAIISGFFLNAFNLFWGPVPGSYVAGFILFLIGLALFITGAAAYCPVNALFHANSCEACRIGETHMHLPV
ncbi:MAG: DUF2892 domain-containing protein [Nitrospirota bacterium]